MSAQWAEENLNTIRTLMERASVYRRALAPIAIAVGVLGIAAAGLAEAMGWTGKNLFAGYWLGVGAVTVLAALLLVRRQALQADEEFWSPPTRRVAQVMAPLLLAGLGLGVLEILNTNGRDSVRLIALWMVLYGGALHASGFFMRRGLKLAGWIFVVLGSICLCFHTLGEVVWLDEAHAHWVMGWAFGANHLAYGLYLKLTPEPMEEVDE
ncbi:MAG: hypothetical protein H8E27_05930 [Verrucomicrobia subdivision 3 bacterium]|nr:hypothetical protein [Limisphaerales bacterium]